MKKISTTATALVLTGLIIFFSACKKDKTTTTDDIYDITATLSGAQEVPAVTTDGTGTVTGSYDAATNMLTFNVSWTNLSGAATAGHFHGPAAAGANATVVVPFTISAGGTTASGNAMLTDQQETDLLSGLWYANVHTAAHAGGEIRGQVTATHH